MGRTAGPEHCQWSRGVGDVKGNLWPRWSCGLKLLRVWFHGIPGSGIRENGQSILFLPILFKVFLILLLKPKFRVQNQLG